MDYGQHFSTQETPQGEKAKPKQVENSAGGFVFQVDKWARLDRFLILGAEGPTYYATERELVRENAKGVLECLAEDGARAVRRIAEISDAGRAPKNDPAIFALAMAAADPKEETRRAALAALPAVCRIGTHLFHFVRDVGKFRKWSRMLRTAVAAWYETKNADAFAYDLLKYQQRDGWAHRDVIRLAHPKAVFATQNAALRWAVGAPMGEREVKRGKGPDGARSKYVASPDVLPRMLAAYDELKKSPSPKETARLVREHGFTHEMVPSEHKGAVEVWEALFEKMPIGALLRNLGKMTNVGLFKPMSGPAKDAAARLNDFERIRKARLHPIAILSALRVYQQGHGEKGKLTWSPEREIVDALDAAFYLAFQAIEPSGKNVLLALDVSGSMDSGTIAGCPGLTPRVASAAMAMVTARAEKTWHAVAFTAPGYGGPNFRGYGTSGFGYGGMHGGGNTSLTVLDISPRERLDDLCEKMRKLPLGGTDCALPMLYAAGENLDVDCFCIYTDSETWANPQIHPFQALKAYRSKSGRAAKLAVVGMTATEFSIADPSDAGMLDFVGFDTAAPMLLADFARGGSAA